MIRVLPAAAVRREFAQWAVARRIRTVESTTFGVPDELFAKVPERLLVGALVEGQRYVPAEPKAEPVPTVPVVEPPTVPVVEPPMVPLVETLSVPVVEPPVPPAVESSAVPVVEPPAAPAAEDTPDADSDVSCGEPDCDYVGKSSHALKVHVGRAHRRESP